MGVVSFPHYKYYRALVVHTNITSLKTENGIVGNNWKRYSGRENFDRRKFIIRMKSVGLCLYIVEVVVVILDSKVHGTNMGPIWGRQDPGGPYVGPMNFAIWDVIPNKMQTMKGRIHE